ncbi:hypothetical protein, partial [Dapis sp. BLCC M229]|uniref:hypothetical protein n=1 Tax=Dapis sp. BLCC M229 TaxID=3400188 RepID=UPI003CF61CF2
IVLNNFHREIFVSVSRNFFLLNFSEYEFEHSVGQISSCGILRIFTPNYNVIVLNNSHPEIGLSLNRKNSNCEF